MQSLFPEQRRELSSKSNFAGFKNIVFHAGSIILIGWLIAQRVPFWPLLMVAQGILIVFLFTLLHETIHRTAFATRLVNDIVAAVCGFLILLPARWFRYFHFEHHRHTQDPQNDPELANEKPQTISQFAWHISGVPVWVAQIRTLVANARGHCEDSFVPSSGLADVQKEAQWMLIGYCTVALISVATSRSDVLWIWLVPCALGQPFLRLYLLAEHGRCAFVKNVFENTRTTFTNKLVRLLCWNMPYHTEHHAYPAVPFHRLPQLHELMRDELRQTESSYTSFLSKYFNDLRHR